MHKNAQVFLGKIRPLFQNNWVPKRVYQLEENWNIRLCWIKNVIAILFLFFSIFVANSLRMSIFRGIRVFFKSNVRLFLGTELAVKQSRCLVTGIHYCKRNVKKQTSMKKNVKICIVYCKEVFLVIFLLHRNIF